MKNLEIIQAQIAQQKARIEYIKELLVPNMKALTLSHQKAVDQVLKEKFFDAADHFKDANSHSMECMTMLAQIAELNEQVQQLEFRLKNQ